MKPHISRVILGYTGKEVWEVGSGQYALFTECFALACCYAATGELKRRFPELRKIEAKTA